MHLDTISRNVYGLHLAMCGFIIFALGFWGWFMFGSPYVEMQKEQTPDTEDPFVLGMYYFNQDENPEGPYDLVLARAYFEDAIREDGADGTFENKWVWYQLGRIDFLEGKFNSAIYKFNKQLEYFGDAPHNVHYMIGLTYGFKAQATNDAEDWENAEAGFVRFIDIAPGHPWPLVDLSWVYFSQGKYEEMVTLLEPEVEKFSDNAWVQNMYGLALLNVGRREEAHEYFARALTLAEELTIQDWGDSYPGNDPRSWQSGLDQMREAIRKNLDLTAQ